MLYDKEKQGRHLLYDKEKQYKLLGCINKDFSEKVLKRVQRYVDGQVHAQ